MTQEEVRLKCVELSIKHYQGLDITPTTILANAKEIENYVSEPTNRRMLEICNFSPEIDLYELEQLFKKQQRAKKAKKITFLPHVDILLDPIREFLSRKKQD